MVTLKVMTWNVENLFQVGSASGPKTQVDYTQKLTSLADVILRLDPDILALQEIGDVSALDDLVAQLDGRYPHIQVSNTPDRRGIRVGFLSKLTIESAEDISTFPLGSLSTITGQAEDRTTEITRLGRGALRILVKPLPSISLHLVTAHLKSKLLSFPGTANRSRFTPKDENERARGAGLALLRRTAEAVALRVKANEILENNAEQSLILLGDFNDVTDATTTQILQGPSGSQIGSRGFPRPDKGDDTRLFNLAPLIPIERRYSRIYRGNQELIDHIFVSQEMLSGKSRQWPKVDSHTDLADTLPSIEDRPSVRRGQPGSDHAPISAVFEL
ncbi:MAG: endonuclease/exonuclease/phosphatase family protein [Cyanobacteria bacterium J06635_1]